MFILFDFTERSECFFDRYDWQNAKEAEVAAVRGRVHLACSPLHSVWCWHCGCTRLLRRERQSCEGHNMSHTCLSRVVAIVVVAVIHGAAACYVFPPEMVDPCRDKRCSFGAQCVPSLDGLTARCQCPQRCDNYGDSVGSTPVCGSDGRDYANTCEMRRSACSEMRDIEKKYDGKCGVLTTMSVECCPPRRSNYLKIVLWKFVAFIENWKRPRKIKHDFKTLIDKFYAIIKPVLIHRGKVFILLRFTYKRNNHVVR